MKKHGIINAELSKYIAGLGHTEKFIICDGGLPIPRYIPIIDLALCNGIPSFKQVFDTVMDEVTVEYYYLSEDIQVKNTNILNCVESSLPTVGYKMLPHNEFNELTKEAKFVVRTGEFTPFANVILTAGVAFKV